MGRHLAILCEPSSNASQASTLLGSLESVQRPECEDLIESKDCKTISKFKYLDM